MADRESETDTRSERRLKRRLYPIRPKSVPLPPPKRRRFSAQKPSPSTPIIVIDLDSDTDDSQPISAPDSTESTLRSSKTEAIGVFECDFQEPALHDGDGKLEHASDDDIDDHLVLDFRDSDVHIKQEPLDLNDFPEEDFGDLDDDLLEQAFRYPSDCVDQAILDCSDSQEQDFCDVDDSLEQDFHDCDDNLEHTSRDRDGHIEQAFCDRDGHIEQAFHDGDDHMEEASNDCNDHIEEVSHDRDEHKEEVPCDRDDHKEEGSHVCDDHKEEASHVCDDHTAQSCCDRGDNLEHASHDRDVHIEQASHDRDGCIEQASHDRDSHIEQASHDRDGHTEHASHGCDDHIEHASHEHNDHTELARDCVDPIEHASRDGDDNLEEAFHDRDDLLEQTSPDHDDYLELKSNNCVPVCKSGQKFDPEYKFFLENMREEEKGFVLEIAAENEAMPKNIRYEVCTDGSSSEFVAEPPKAVRIDMEKINELPSSTKGTTLDGNARDTCASGGSGLAVDNDMVTDGNHDGIVAETPKRVNSLDIMEEKNYRLENDEIDSDGLTGDCDIPVIARDSSCKWDPTYKFFLENLREGAKGYTIAVPLVISYEMSANGLSDGLVAKISEVLMIEKEKMGSREVEVPCSSGRNSLDVMEEKNARLDGDGDGDADDTNNCDMLADGYFDGAVAETAEVERNGVGDMGSHHEEVPYSSGRHSVEAMDEDTAELDDSGDAKDICFADDGLTINSEMPANDGYFGVFVAETETQNVMSNGTRDVVCNHEEVTRKIEIVTSDVMEENNDVLNLDADAEANCDERHSPEVMVEKNPMLDDVGDAKYNCTIGNRLEVIEDMNIRLVGDAKNICFADDDGLTIDSEMAVNDGWYFDGFVTETETQNVVSNGSMDMVCNHEELTTSIERVTSDVMEENNAGLDHDDDDDAEANGGWYFGGFVAETETQNVVSNGSRGMVCNHEELASSIERVTSDVMEENNAGLDHDDDDDAEANGGWYFGGFVAETETQNVVSNESMDMVCNHEELTSSIESVTSDVMVKNTAGLDHDDDAEANCDERHSPEVMVEESPMLDDVCDAKYNCTVGNSLEVIEDMNIRLVGDPDGDAKKICFADDDGLTTNSEMAVNDGWYFGGFVAETETQNVVSNGSRDMVCNCEELTLSIERVTSDVMEENNAGLDHDNDAEANRDERHNSEVMEEENLLLANVGDAKYNCTDGKSLEVIEHMNTRLVDDGIDKDNCVSDCDGGTEVDFVSDCNGNCAPDCNNEARDNCVSDGNGGIEVNLVSGCNVKAKGNCVSDCNGEAGDDCVFGGDGYGEAKEDFVTDNDPNGNCVLDCNAYSKYNCAPESGDNDDSDVNGNCARDAGREDDCVPDGDPNGFPEVNGDDNRHYVSDSNEDNVEDHCVSDGDNANAQCAYGEHDVEDHCVSDGGDANKQCAYGENDVNHSISDSDDVSYRSISDADDVEYYCLSDDDDAIHSHVSISGSNYDLESDDTVDECYKLFLRCLKPDGEAADCLAPKSKMNRAGNDHADSDEEEKPNIDKGPNTPFAAYISRNNTGYTGTVIRTKLSKFKDKVKFREELMDILKKPYDQNEYDKLWDEIYRRMPVEGSRVLRRKTKRYLANRAGKSYLDHHPDLASAIKSVENDKPRVLNQLRGFFYWMKNLSHQGSFIPWKDSMCLKTVPET